MVHDCESLTVSFEHDIKIPTNTGVVDGEQSGHAENQDKCK
jgi:hypothetical protein